MKFSTKAEYGLKAIVNLAQCFPKQKTIKEIATEEDISQKYLERLLGTLRDGGVVESSKGKLGGQHKVPRLSNDRTYLEEILSIR